MTTSFDPDIAPVFERIDTYEEWQKDEGVKLHSGLYINVPKTKWSECYTKEVEARYESNI